MPVDRSSIVSNMVGFCSGSPKRVSILKAVSKPKNYVEVAAIVKATATYCSKVLSRMEGIGLVEPVEGKRGFYRWTDVMRTINIDLEMRKVGAIPKGTPRESEIVKEVQRVFEIEKASDFLDLDSAIKNDCFPPRNPYHKDVGEAFLKLEHTLREELSLPRNLVGVKLVGAAATKGLFNREVEAERNGLVSLYMGAFGWFRNVFHHSIEDTSREEAIKLILFADYLIKLVRKLKEENKIT
jgi:hypothetical protein